MKHKLDIVESVMHYKSIMLLMLVIGVAFGVYSLVNMPKNEFPSYTIRQGVVVGVYPWCHIQRGGGTDDQTVGEIPLGIQRNQEGKDLF
jgi:hypothetical protein